MQIDPANSNRKVGLWLGRPARKNGAGLRGEAPRPGPRRPFRNHPRTMEDEYDDDDEWDHDGGSSLSGFVHPRHLTEKKPSNSSLSSTNSSNSARAAASRQRKAMKKAAMRMRPKKESSSAQSRASQTSKNDLSDILEMPKWEHPTPGYSGNSRKSRGDASTKSKGRLGQLLDGGDDSDEEEEEERRETYLQRKMVGGDRSSAKSKASAASRSSQSVRSKDVSGASLGAKSIALHLQEMDSDDESTGIDLFRGGKRSHVDDDGGSISSASIECFKPKPSKQELAQDALRSFDAELRMEAEKSRNTERYHHKPTLANQEMKAPVSPKPLSSERVESSSLVNTKTSMLQPPPSPPRNGIENNSVVNDDDNDASDPVKSLVSSPSRKPNRHVPRGNVPSISQSYSPVRRPSPRALLSVSKLPVVPMRNRSNSAAEIFNNSLKLEGLELDGSINFGDIEPFTASYNAEDDDDDNNSIGMQSCSSIASVDMMSDKEKEDLEEKMIQMALEESLHSTSSILDNLAAVPSHGSVSFNASSGSFAVVDIGDFDDEDMSEFAMAEDEFEKEMIELAIQRSLNDSRMNDSKKSDYTATTNPITSDCGDSSGTSGSTTQSQALQRQKMNSGGISNHASGAPHGSLATPYNGNGSSTANEHRDANSSRPFSARSTSSHTGSSVSSRSDNNILTSLRSPRTSRRREDPQGRLSRAPSSRLSIEASLHRERNPRRSTRMPRQSSRKNRPVQDI